MWKDNENKIKLWANFLATLHTGNEQTKINYSWFLGEGGVLLRFSRQFRFIRLFVSASQILHQNI